MKVCNLPKLSPLPCSRDPGGSVSSNGLMVFSKEEDIFLFLLDATKIELFNSFSSHHNWR